LANNNFVYVVELVPVIIFFRLNQQQLSLGLASAPINVILEFLLCRLVIQLRQVSALPFPEQWKIIIAELTIPNSQKIYP